MSSQTAGGSAGSKRPLVIALAAVGAVLLILTVLYLTGINMGPLTSAFHTGKTVSGMHGKRAIVTGVLGVAALVGAFFMNKKSAS